LYRIHFIYTGFLAAQIPLKKRGTKGAVKLPEKTQPPESPFRKGDYLGGKKYVLYAAVILPDHFHLIIQPTEKGKDTYYSLSE